MRYEGKIYRPPGEWRSYLLQCTVGCTHNKCTFCGMYKEKKFHVRPMKEIMEDIAMARVYYDPATVDKVFLCDGDAIVMRQEHLLQILEALYAAFPNLRQVTTYAGTRSTKTKSLEQLNKQDKKYYGQYHNKGLISVIAVIYGDSSKSAAADDTAHCGITQNGGNCNGGV